MTVHVSEGAGVVVVDYHKYFWFQMVQKYSLQNSGKMIWNSWSSHAKCNFQAKESEKVMQVITLSLSEPWNSLMKLFEGYNDGEKLCRL